MPLKNNEPPNEPPDFSDEIDFPEPEPPSRPAPVQSQTPPPPPTVDISELFKIIELSNDAQIMAQRIGSRLCLRASDAMWAPILLAARHIDTTAAVPALIQTAVQAAIKDAAETASAVAASEVRKKVLSAIAERDKISCAWADRATAWGIVAAMCIMSFLAGNTVPQLEFCVNLAKIFGF